MFRIPKLIENPLALVGLALFVTTTASAQKFEGSVLHDAATGKLRAAKIVIGTPQTGAVAARASAAKPIVKTMPFFSSARLKAALEAVDIRDIREEEAGGLVTDNPVSISKDTLGCGQRNSNGNVRVNQDCTFRFQAEEKIVFNPADPNNLIGGLNDGRVGFNQCSIAWSLNNGATWGDLLPPFRAKVNFPLFEEPTASDPNRHTIAGGPGTLHTYDAGSDPAPAFDSQGDGFFSCVAFDVFTNASMIYVTQSPREAQGSFFGTIAPFGRAFVVAEDNDPTAQHDKEFITADIFPSSPNRDNVYVTWTVFKFDPRCGPQPNPNQNPQFCAASIFGSMSTDHARTWSTPEEISGASNTLCFFGNFFDPTRSPHACDFDQGADPIALPNGDLEVVFNNLNTAAANPNAQQLGVHCHPTGSSPTGTAHLNCAAPSKVGDDVVVDEPLCDFGRGPEECIPGAYIRTNDFPRIGENRATGRLFATWQDYRNGEYDIELSSSSDGGLTWHELGTVNPDGGLDHYLPAIDVSTGRGGGENRAGGDRVGVSYFRSERVPNEDVTPDAGFFPCPGVIPLFANPLAPAPAPPCQAGVGAKNSDYVVSGGAAPSLPFNFAVVSPVFPPPDAGQAGFNGDYSGLVINHDEEAHPIWSDTRNVNPFAPANVVIHDEDAFTTAVHLPSGRARMSKGHIGRNNDQEDHKNGGS